MNAQSRCHCALVAADLEHFEVGFGVLEPKVGHALRAAAVVLRGAGAAGKAQVQLVGFERQVRDALALKHVDHHLRTHQIIPQKQ